MATSLHSSRMRSLYRKLLRELPPRKPSILASPSPLQDTIRSSFAAPANAEVSQAYVDSKLESGDQLVQYLHAQRSYITLIERYNPGMNMSEEERVRLTARRVGMDLPAELRKVLGNGNGNDRSKG